MCVCVCVFLWICAFVCLFVECHCLCPFSHHLKWSIAFKIKHRNEIESEVNETHTWALNIEHWPFSNVLIEMNFVKWDFFTLVLSSNISIVYQLFSSFSHSLYCSFALSFCYFNILFSTWALLSMFGVHLFKQNEMLFNENKVIKWNVWRCFFFLSFIHSVSPTLNYHDRTWIAMDNASIINNMRALDTF